VTQRETTCDDDDDDDERRTTTLNAIVSRFALFSMGGMGDF
jgi:hypothetical protein